jgi:hypothetical protein
MNINEVNTSRQLAAMIQGIDGDKRARFLKDAREAKDMESFIKHFMSTNYNDE